MGAALPGMSVAALARLSEDLLLAIGPERLTRKQNARCAVERARRRPFASAQSSTRWTHRKPAALAEASKRFKLSKDGKSVADFILRPGDGAHLRLDVQRGNIKLLPKPKGGRNR